jgi:multimeric flavodoxin WrbA
MMVLGICGSPRKEKKSGVYKLVNTVLEATGVDYEFVHLRKKQISGCIGCVKDNVCKVEDDLEPIRAKIVEADGYVIGAPNYYSGINATTHAFLERWFQFRHQEGDLLWGKLGVAVGVGGTEGHYPADEIEKFFLYNFKVGIPYFLHGEGVKISEEIIPDVTKQPEVMQAAVEAGKKLGQRLQNGDDRMQVTQKMQAVMMEKFQGSV